MLDNINFSHEKNLSENILIQRIQTYYPDATFSLFKIAYEFVKESHKGQFRNSGEEYFIHPLNVAATLIKLKLDLDSIIAGLLHDVIEDCDVTVQDIENKFGTNIANIVLGLTKISQIKFKTKEESQAENFRKMIVAMAKDVRVIIVKLADRMHNMRTLEYVSKEKQQQIAKETLEIYVPLASRLGINSLKAELEDLCLRFLKPKFYYELADKVAMKKADRDKYIYDVIAILYEKLSKNSIQSNVHGRPKHFYSIYKKMLARGVDFEQIQDILAFRIVLKNITGCYQALGVIHSSYTPIPGRFKDFIAIPKVNNYQSLHTTVIGPQAERIEIQIRTFEMDAVAERGIAAHWKYKEGIKHGDKKFEWMNDLIEFNQNVVNNFEFMDVVKNDLDVGGIFIFTPAGDVLELRYRATPLDFAYTVHTEIGHHCIGAKVNGKIVPLRSTLKSGDSVEILTSKGQVPSKDWLDIVKSSRVKTKIRQWFVRIDRDKNKKLGKETLEKALKVYFTSIKNLKKIGEFSKILENLHILNEDELYITIGLKKLDISVFLNLVSFIQIQDIENSKDKNQKKERIESLSKEISEIARKKTDTRNAVIVDEMNDVLVRCGKCCNPIPGDKIIGYITRGRGITVHIMTCKGIDIGDRSRMINVSWNKNLIFKHSVNICIITHDQDGIFLLISKAISRINIKVKGVTAKSLVDKRGGFIFEIEVKDDAELFKTISEIESLKEVISVTRGHTIAQQ